MPVSLILIVLTVVLPIIVMQKKNAGSTGVMVVYCIVFSVLWWIINAPLHELSHWLGFRAAGVEVEEMQLFPKYLEGEFRGAWIKTGDADPARRVVGVLSPYIINLISVVAGYFVVKRARIESLPLMNVVLVVLVLCPLFNILDNLLGFAIENFGDFGTISRLLGPSWAYAVGTALGLSISVTAILTLKAAYSKKYR